MEKGLTNIAGAIIVVGLACLAVYAELHSNYKIGDGWALLAVLTWLFYDWRTNNK